MEHLVGHGGNAHDVLIRLGGETQHVIELHGVPSALKGDAAGVEQVLLGDIFVNSVPKALAAALHSEGKAAFANPLQLFHQLHGEVICSQRRERHADAPGLAEFQQPVAYLTQMPIVAGGEGEERKVLIAGVFQRFDALPNQRLRFFCTDRPIDISSLAKTAAANAAPEDLQIHPILHHLSGRNDGVNGERHRVQILHNPLGDSLRRTAACTDFGDGSVIMIGDIVKRRNVNPADPGSLLQKTLLAPPLQLGLSQQGEELVVHLLPLPDDEEIHKRRHRLRVNPSRTACKHQRQEGFSVTGTYR